MVDKADVRARFRASLEARIASMQAEVDNARSGTRVDGEHRPANRGERAAVTGQGYLAQGIGQRLDDLREDLRHLDLVAPVVRDRVSPGAVFRVVDEHDHCRTYFLLPGGQGDEFDDVVIVSAQAPVAQALLGLGEGDEATAVVRGVEVELELGGVS